ncbi:hypothetical protein CAP40_19600 [Sphingomonas sp. IBVSS2]|nr:hypothetical protein CAP40_19600 [Sphingomonas sp. IBVSS2]
MAIIKMPERRSMAADLVDQLREKIRSGELSPGDKLPTERALVEDLGISRTVVREAVARLSAEGWVEARQGSGVFIKEPPQAFQIDPNELADLHDVLQLLELRLAVETEMAGLAAERRTEADITELEKWLEILRDASTSEDGGVKADAALHASIARAAGNQYFVRFVEFLGSKLVPRRDAAMVKRTEEKQRRYLDTIQEEHAAIVDAIRAGDPRAARSAARRHLERSLKRARRIADTVADLPALTS